MKKLLERLSLFSMQQVFIIGAALSGFYYFMMFDSGESIKTNILQVDTNIQSEETKKKQTDENLKKEKEMKDLVGLLGKQFQENQKKLPAKLDSTDLQREINGFAKISRVSIPSFTPNTPKTVEIVNEIPADLVVEGAFAQIAHFINLVSKSEKVMSVRNVSIETIAQTPGRLRMLTQVIGYEMVIDTKPAATAAAPGAPAK